MMMVRMVRMMVKTAMIMVRMVKTLVVKKEKGKEELDYKAVNTLASFL